MIITGRTPRHRSSGSQGLHRKGSSFIGKDQVRQDTGQSSKNACTGSLACPQEGYLLVQAEGIPGSREKRGTSQKFDCQAFCSDGSLETTVRQIIFKAKKHFEPVSGLVVHHKGFVHESYLSPMGKGGSLQ